MFCLHCVCHSQVVLALHMRIAMTLGAQAAANLMHVCRRTPPYLNILIHSAAAAAHLIPLSG
jgi:hypothetical protein